MRYTERAPSPALAAIVKCIWTLEGDAAELGADVQPVLPDGRPELVMQFGDVFERLGANDTLERQPTILFAGQLTGELVLRPTGRIATLGVRFHPDGAGAILPCSQEELVGHTIAVDSVSPTLSRFLREVRDSTSSLDEAAKAVEQGLADRINGARVDRRVRRAVEIIGRQQGRIPVAALAHHVGVTRRHLERRFKTLVGVSPKRLSRIARFQHALRVLERVDVEQKSTATAVTCGYADQAHFIREFRELAGCPPRAHLLRHAELAGLFTR